MFSSSACIVVEVLGTEGWILDTNYPVEHVGTGAGVSGLRLPTEDAQLQHRAKQVMSLNPGSTVFFLMYCSTVGELFICWNL